MPKGNPLPSLCHGLTFGLFKRLERPRACPEVEFLIENAPGEMWGVVGESYTNWVYQQGFFAALMKCCAPQGSLRIVDFGCGHGKMAPVSMFFTHPAGEYLGIDIQESTIDFCRKKYSRLPGVKFHLSKDVNPFYPAQAQSGTSPNRACGQDWPVAPESVDVVIAISVFTHLKEAEAFGYADRIHTILKPGAVAILTFHILEEPRRKPVAMLNYSPRLARLLEFPTALPGRYNWFTSCPDLPESGIAVNSAALNSLIQGKFRMESLVKGSATGGIGPLPQDVVVLRKLS